MTKNMKVGDVVHVRGTVGRIEDDGQRTCGLLLLAHAVAEHFAGTDSPLGEQARALIAKATGAQP